MAEVHDCFTPTELVLMEDLGFAERGTAWKEVLAGTFDLDGDLPVNPDGGLKASATRSARPACACCSSAGCSCAARPGERQIASDRRAAGRSALTHNLGGSPGECVSFVVASSAPSRG